MSSLGLSVVRICLYADHVIARLSVMDFSLDSVSRRDVERVVAWINRQPYREWTEQRKKLVLRKQSNSK